MERDEVGFISKKRRVTQSTVTRYVDNVYRLYFKGLVSNDIEDGKKTAMAGFGVAICDQMDELFIEIKELVSDAKINSKGVDIRALIRGLSESLNLGIRKVVIYCDDYQIYQNIMTGKSNHKPERVIQQLMEQIQFLRQKFDLCAAILVPQSDIKFAFKLARETIVSQISGISKVKGEVCVICQEETEADRMFVFDKCLHRHCYSCVNQFVEVKLGDGHVPTCLDYECNLELTLENCSKVLKPKVIELWKHKMNEDSIPVSERIYCPYPNCSMLMSKTEISRSDQTFDGTCVKCFGLFCIECKLPSHSDFSCAEYKKLRPDLLVDDLKLKSLAKDQKWRQCVKCGHMIELIEGCNHMTCRCGYEFCYECGGKWDDHDHDDSDSDSPSSGSESDSPSSGSESDSPSSGYESDSPSSGYESDSPSSGSESDSESDSPSSGYESDSPSYSYESASPSSDSESESSSSGSESDSSSSGSESDSSSSGLDESDREKRKRRRRA